METALYIKCIIIYYYASNRSFDEQFQSLFLRVTQVCLVIDRVPVQLGADRYTSVIALADTHTPVHRRRMSRTASRFVTVLCYKYTPSYNMYTHTNIYRNVRAKDSHTRIHLILSTNSKSGRERTFRL